MKNAATSEQNKVRDDIFSIIEEKLPVALPNVGEHFTCVSYAPGFYYGIVYGNNAYYNGNTLSTLDSTLKLDSLDDMIISGNLSKLYKNVLSVTSYGFSEETVAELSKKDEQLQAKLTIVLTQFTDAGFKFSDPLPPGGKIQDVYNQLSALYGPITKTCDNLPVTLALLRNALADYNIASGDSYTIRYRAQKADSTLAEAISHIEKPAAENGGLQTGDSAYYVGFDKLPTLSDLSDSLGSDENVLKISLQADQFTQENCTVHTEGKGGVLLPIGSLLDITFSDSTTVDTSSFTSSETKVTIDMTYPGLTVVGDVPLALSADDQKGWYDVNILDEIKSKTGDSHVDGYKLQGTEFNVGDLFGLKGSLNFFKTFVISRHPTIEVTFQNVDVEKFTKHVHSEKSVQISLFGFINLGKITNSYSLDEVKSDSSTRTVTLSFKQPDMSSSVAVEDRTAYLLGGVPTYVD